jgi:hypothetical protein
MVKQLNRTPNGIHIVCQRILENQLGRSLQPVPLGTVEDGDGMGTMILDGVEGGEGA